MHFKNLLLLNRSLWLACLFFLSGLAFAQENSTEIEPDYGEIRSSIESAIQAENESLLEFKQELTRTQAIKAIIETELQTYNFLLSVHGNLLLLPDVETRGLEKALGDNQAASTNVSARIKEYVQNQDRLLSALQQTNDRIEISSGQLKEISTAKAPITDIKSMEQGLNALLAILKKKRDILEKTKQVQSDYLADLGAVGTSLNDLSSRLNERIKSRKKQQYLERKRMPLASLSVSQIKIELDQLKQQLVGFAVKESWVNALRFDWKPARAYVFTFLIIWGILQYFLIKFRRYLNKFLDRSDIGEASNTRAALELIHGSVLLAGTTLLASIFLYSNIVFITAPFYQGVFKILLVILLTRWGKDFTANYLKNKDWLDNQEISKVIRACHVIRYVVILYVAVAWLSNSETVFLFILRFLSELYLFIWLVRFCRKVWARKAMAQQHGKPKPVSLLPLVSGWSYAVIGAGMVLDVVGYPSLSVYWLTNWGITAIILLWAILGFFSLQEWRMQLKHNGAAGVNESQKSRQPFWWLLLQVAWIIWLVAILLLLIFTWGGKQAVIINSFHWLNYPITIGKISFSLINLVFAFIIIILTQMLTKVWRSVLSEKVLAESGMDTGLQDSIVTITVYTLWVFGILISLHVFGFGTTTLALAFGALGIGLGFGLQNIFNNFISGIILLFERPIQVGDDVEINGTWATVKKINVRATVVQTYNNASLIIPNSEFISSQVTNWSFKDKRLRRQIDVGVAYGSDINLVRKTLLEIATGTPKVLKNPKPDVLFKDFGDSSLVFRLRIWTDIDNMLIVETAIRFEIDRLFKQRGIVIAFPQRDVHLFVENGSDVDAPQSPKKKSSEFEITNE